MLLQYGGETESDSSTKVQPTPVSIRNITIILPPKKGEDNSHCKKKSIAWVGDGYEPLSGSIPRDA